MNSMLMINFLACFCDNIYATILFVLRWIFEMLQIFAITDNAEKNVVLSGICLKVSIAYIPKNRISGF